MGSLAEGATNAVKVCAGVTSTDRVLIVTDRPTLEIAEAIYTVASSIATSRMFVLEDHAPRPLREIPAEVMGSIPGATVTFWIAQPYPGELAAKSSFIREAVKHARHAHMTGINKQIMEQGMCADYDLVYRTTLKVHDVVKNAKTLSVSSAEGTSLRIELNRNWRWIPSHGTLRKKGEWGNLPDGEVFTAPHNVNGTIIVSELGDWFAAKYGYIRRKVRIPIRYSRVDLERIGCENTVLRSDLTRYLSTDGNSSRASEFAVPTNQYLMDRPLIGNLLQDEKARVHIAFGDPYGWQAGAGWRSNTHVDCILEGCDVTADGAEVMKAGKLVIDSR